MKRFEAWVIVVLIATMLWVQSANAEPGRLTEYLMDEPVTMWDWGMRRLNDKLSSPTAFGTTRDENGQITYDESGAFLAGAFASYLWETDRIRILITPPGFPILGSTTSEGTPRDEAEARQWCKEAISRVKWALGIDPATAGPITGLEHSFVGRLFSHSGFTDPAKPSRFDERIDSMVEIRVLVSHRGGGTVVCQARLRETSLYWVDE